MTESKDLKPKEIENFTKIINDYIASNTSSSLSTLLVEPIDFKVIILDTRYFNPEKIRLTSDEIPMCGVRLSGKGDVNIEICYAIKIKFAKIIAAKLLGQKEVKEIDEIGTSAIQEVANILTGSFFNSLSKQTGFRVDLSTPDSLQSDVNLMIKDSTKNVVDPNKSAIVADAELVGKKSGIRIHMLIVQNVDDARKIINKNGNKNISEFSSLESSESFSTGGKNEELDSLVEELQREVN